MSDYIKNVDVTEIKCYLLFTDRAMEVRLLLGPPATISEANLVFEALSSLGIDDRLDLNTIVAQQMDASPHQLAPCFANSGAQNNEIRFEFIPSATGAGFDSEVCPGCGTFLGGDLNPLCEHKDGCAGMRKIPVTKVQTTCASCGQPIEVHPMFYNPDFPTDCLKCYSRKGDNG